MVVEMNKADAEYRHLIIQMARDAGCTANEANAWSGFLERFFQLATELEREQCAKVCDIHARGWEMHPGQNPQAGFIATSNCAAAIRARSKE